MMSSISFDPTGDRRGTLDALTEACRVYAEAHTDNINGIGWDRIKDIHNIISFSSFVLESHEDKTRAWDSVSPAIGVSGVGSMILSLASARLCELMIEKLKTEPKP